MSKQNKQEIEKKAITTKSPKGKNPKTKKSGQIRINWLLVFALICVAIPSGALAWILLTAAGDSGVPALGSRFDSAFAYTLSNEDLKTIQSEISEIPGVEKVIISMPVATLRIYVDVDDNLSDAKIQEITVKVYEKLNARYPIERFFTNSHSGIVQYDLEIYVYNNLQFDENFIYYRLVKNAVSDAESIQNVGKPLDPALAERLRNPEDITDGETGLEGDDDRKEDSQ